MAENSIKKSGSKGREIQCVCVSVSVSLPRVLVAAEENQPPALEWVARENCVKNTCENRTIHTLCNLICTSTSRFIAVVSVGQRGVIVRFSCLIACEAQKKAGFFDARRTTRKFATQFKISENCANAIVHQIPRKSHGTLLRIPHALQNRNDHVG